MIKLLDAIKAYAKAKKRVEDTRAALELGDVTPAELARMCTIETDRWNDVEEAMKGF